MFGQVEITKYFLVILYGLVRTYAYIAFFFEIGPPGIQILFGNAQSDFHDLLLRKLLSAAVHRRLLQAADGDHRGKPPSGGDVAGQFREAIVLGHQLPIAIDVALLQELGAALQRGLGVSLCFPFHGKPSFHSNCR